MMIRFTTLLLAIIALSCTNSQEPQVCPNPMIDSVAVVKCLSVVDGDTWKFQIGKDVFSVRVLGIDCFETRHGSRLDSQATRAGISVDSALALGKMAKALADSLLTGRELKIVRDYNEDNFDTYNRLLRHTYIVDQSWAGILRWNGLVTK